MNRKTKQQGSENKASKRLYVRPKLEARGRLQAVTGKETITGNPT